MIGIGFWNFEVVKTMKFCKAAKISNMETLLENDP